MKKRVFEFLKKISEYQNLLTTEDCLTEIISNDEIKCIFDSRKKMIEFYEKLENIGFAEIAYFLPDFGNNCYSSRVLYINDEIINKFLKEVLNNQLKHPEYLSLLMEKLNNIEAFEKWKSENKF